jgi:hypothetical protein
MNYTAAYKSLIERARHRDYSFIEGEWHHAIPRCMGGTDERCKGPTTINANVVKLTYREHLFAHRLLCRIYPAQRGLIQVVARIARKYKVIGKEQYKLYEADRRRLALQMSHLHAGKTISAEQRQKASAFHKGRKQPPRTVEHSRKLGEAHKGIPCPEHVKQAVARAATGRVKSQEERAKISTAHKGRTFSQETKDKMSAQSHGRCWVSLEGVSKRVKRDELETYLTNGFTLGRS